MSVVCTYSAFIPPEVSIAVTLIVAPGTGSPLSELVTST